MWVMGRAYSGLIMCGIALISMWFIKSSYFVVLKLIVKRLVITKWTIFICT